MDLKTIETKRQYLIEEGASLYKLYNNKTITAAEYDKRAAAISAELTKLTRQEFQLSTNLEVIQ